MGRTFRSGIHVLNIVPYDADVIIAGAGPAGAVAAMQLAKAGRKVLLLDRSRFPRDKACGDGLIADSIGALRTLALDDRVQALAYRTSRLLTISPGGVPVQFDSEFLVVPRLLLDNLLFERAVASGAEFRHVVVSDPIVERGQVVGVAGKQGGSDAEVQLRAPLTLLATGAAGQVLTKFDPRARAESSGLAVRTYARRPAGEPPIRDLMISLERDLLPGYAWVFPAPDGLVNVGVGAISNRGKLKGHVNLRSRLDDLLAGKGQLGAMVGRLESIDKYRGAPLRTGLKGARLGRPGLAIIGEAAGTTYSVTGEGIGKAMESGLLIAEIAARQPDSLLSVGLAYAEEMKTRYASRFRAYETAERWVGVPWVADYVARRANESRWVHDRLTGIITERSLPSRVFSFSSIWKLLTRA